MRPALECVTLVDSSKDATKRIAPEARGPGSETKDSNDGQLATRLRAIDNHVVISSVEGDAC